MLLGSQGPSIGKVTIHHIHDQHGVIFSPLEAMQGLQGHGSRVISLILANNAPHRCQVRAGAHETFKLIDVGGDEHFVTWFASFQAIRDQVDLLVIIMALLALFN